MNNKRLIIGITQNNYSVVCYRVTTRVELVASRIYNKQEFSIKVVKRFLEEYDLHPVEAKVILGPQLYRILMMDRPNIKDEELTQAARWLAKDLIKDNLDDVVVV